jgi:Tol biopolymer transport system component
MGIVYRATDLELDREIALKCVRPDREADPDQQRRLQREAKAASALSHPNIVTVFDVLEVDDKPAIIMELIDGSSLRQTLDSGGPMDFDTVLRHGEALADALSYAHGKKILHRDINPNNIVLGRDGRILLMDFGLAGRFAPPGEESVMSTATLTGTGLVVGTPGYMSPDQLLGKTLDQRSDIFSFGIVLYEMCTGERAFPTAKGDFIDATLNREPMPIARLNYAVPEEYERIVRKALAKRPDERYQQAGEISADIRALRRRTESTVLTAQQVHRQQTPWRRFVHWAAGLVLIAAAVLVWQMMARSKRLNEIPRHTALQLTSSPALDDNPEISPDGREVVFQSDQGGSPDIWIVDVATRNRRQLTTSPSIDSEPTWFPDGSRIAFESDRSGSIDVWTTTRYGDTPVLLVPGAHHPAISPDGNQIAFVRRGETGEPRIWVAPLDDVAAARRLTDDEQNIREERRPVWSPDGNAITFDDHYEKLWVTSASGGTAEELVSEGYANQHPAWAPGGYHIYFSSLLGTTRSLWRVRSSGGEPQQVTLGTGLEGEPSISSDGGLLAYATQIEHAQILLIDRKTGDTTTLPELPEVYNPVITGKRDEVLFRSIRDGLPALWETSISGIQPVGEPRQKAGPSGDIATFVLSPDGRYLVYGLNIDRRRDIWIGPAEGGPPINLTDHVENDIHPAWSRDGSRLAFVSERGGQPDIWILPMSDGRASGPPEQVTRSKADKLFPAWSPDGSMLAYIATDEVEDVWVVAVDGDRDPTRVTTGATALDVDWSHEAGRVLVSAYWGESSVELRSVGIADGDALSLDPPMIFGAGGSVLGDFCVSSDGTLIAYVKQHFTGDIWLIEATDGSF